MAILWPIFPSQLGLNSRERLRVGGEGEGAQGLIFPCTRCHLKLDGRAELERLEGRVQTLYSVRVTAGRGGGGGGMLAMLVVFVRLFMSFLHFLPHLLVHHHSRSPHARWQGIHKRRARNRWWVRRWVGTRGLASGVPWLWRRIRGPAGGKSWIPLGSPWGSWIGARGVGGIHRWRMGRIGTSRVRDVRGIWMRPWLSGIGIPHVRGFPAAPGHGKEPEKASREDPPPLSYGDTPPFHSPQGKWRAWLPAAKDP